MNEARIALAATRDKTVLAQPWLQAATKEAAFFDVITAITSMG